MGIICIYHSKDLDGWMSAAIVKKWFEEEYKNDSYDIIDSEEKVVQQRAKGNNSGTLTMLGWDYGDEIPDLSRYHKVIMCDVSFPKEVMQTIEESSKTFIWIDHHISAINNSKADKFYEYDKMKGIRDTNFAACELTWKYFFPNEEIPEIVRLLGMYDSFRHRGTDEEEKVTQFQYAAKAYIRNFVEASLSLKKCDIKLMIDLGASIYNYILQEVEGIYKNADIIAFKLNTLAEIGDIIYEGSDGSNTIHWKKGIVKQVYPYGSSIDTYEYLIEMESGKEILEYHMNCKVPYCNYKFLCTNKGTVNPKAFGLNEEDYECDGFVNFVYDKDKWRFTLYSSKVDCSKIAKQYGGGGHKGAAGFIVDTGQMLEIIDHE